MQDSNNSNGNSSLPKKERKGGVSGFWVRTFTSVAFVIIMVGGILWSPLSCAALFALITIMSVWEFTGVVNTRSDIQVNRFITTVAGLCLYLGTFGYVTGVETVVPVFVPWMVSMIYLLIGELYLQRENPLNNWAYSMMAQIYVALPFSLIPLLLLQPSGILATSPVPHAGAYIILFIFIFLWCNDAGAYCVGSLIGRHKLFPRISPGKTWEGSIGGGVLTIIASQLIYWYGPDDAATSTVFGLSALQWAGFALVVVVFGTWGDLVESLLKRTLGIKDSGHLLPGHGGMLDRFDSSLMAIPASLVYLSVLALF